MTRSPILRVALIGLGSIGQVVARELLARQASVLPSTPDSQSPSEPRIELVGALCRHPQRHVGLARPVVATWPELMALQPDLVIEAAGHEAVQAHGADALRAGCDLLLVSVGALCDAHLQIELEQAARQSGRQILLPAGALGGLDQLQAAQLAGLHSVRLRSRKPPLAWAGTHAERLVDLAATHSATPFFRGSAREAARLFPKNANVAATLALATLGWDATEVELIADPAVSANVHEIEARGVAGELHLRLVNSASPDNPKTSLITPYSVLRSLFNRRAAMAF